MTAVATVRRARGSAWWTVATVLLLALSAAVVLLRHSDERQIKKQMAALAEAVSVPAREGDIPRLARAQRVRKALAPDVTVRFEREGWPPVEGRDAVAGLVARRWPQTDGGVTVELRDLAVHVDSETGLADVRFRARVVSQDAGAEPTTLDGRMVALTLRKIDGDWLVASVRVMESDDAERN